MIPQPRSLRHQRRQGFLELLPSPDTLHLSNADLRGGRRTRCTCLPFDLALYERISNLRVHHVVQLDVELKAQRLLVAFAIVNQ
ncbi:hypothetical protein HKD37_07G019906 [Glycine soja]